jgi:hypothetical protein
LIKDVWAKRCFIKGGIETDIHRVTCVGAGLIGQDWATLFSSMAIPMNLATQSEGIWPAIPIERGHLF